MAQRSAVQQNYHVECEGGLNAQINLHLHASYVLLALAHNFDRDDLGLQGLHRFFKKASDEERENAEVLMTYQNQRGGRIALRTIQKPDQDEWQSGIVAMETMLILHKRMNQGLLDLHAVSVLHGDKQMSHFLAKEFLAPRVDVIKELSDHVTRLRKVGPGLGEHVHSQELAQLKEAQGDS